ncbi:MAG: hypothetical protein IKO72_08230 [Kiritimatiellae bacterium]|nr:hypothetical protein [Kiritimatiellia bacterium]
MKHLTLLCTADSTERTLESLRNLKCAHLDVGAAPSAETAEAKEVLSRAETAIRILAKAAEDSKVSNGLNGSNGLKAFNGLRGEALVDAVLAADAKRRELEDVADKLRHTITRYEPYGDFDPALARELLDLGIDLASVAELPDPLPCERLSETRRKLAAAETEIAGITASLAAADAEARRITAEIPAFKDRIAFAAARDEMEREGEVAWICGWIPQDAVPAVRASAAREGWGLLVRDPEPGETPPTYIRPPKLFRPVTALFEGLGIAPAYEESDVSVPFFCYFTLFFAMLVGDGGYGLILLFMTLWGWRRTKPREGTGHRPRAVRSWLTLMTVFSAGTVMWGILSNTWFGASIPAIDVTHFQSAAMQNVCLALNSVFNGASVKWLADPSYNNMMFLCFTIGVSHLMLARIWNAVCMINSLACIAELGWAGILLFMYFVVNAIIGIFPSVPAWSFWLFGVSVVLVVSRTRGSALGMLPLNIMGAMGDIISYVRLFAVGYASLQVAQNFNRMAIELELPVWAKIVPMVLILLVGHVMNFMLAGLAVLVHAVRLNTLEFSNHKGITWSGQAFCPFRKN